MPRWRVRRLTRYSVLTAAQIPEISTAIAHLRKVLGDLAYESLAKHGETMTTWTAVRATMMFALAAGKARTGRALNNPVLQAEGRVTLIDGLLAAAVLVGLVFNTALGWWWADPLAGYVLVFYALREVREIFAHQS